MRVYISGPMTGLPDCNRAAFDAAAKRLAEQGFFAVSPADISRLFGDRASLEASFAALYQDGDSRDPACKPRIAKEKERDARLARAVMEADLAAVRSCDAIYLLCGWQSSRGAKRELAEALACGLRIMSEGGVQ